MSTVPGSTEDELYCDPDDVSVFFDKFSGPDGDPMFSDGFGPQTNPSEAEVIMLIEEATEWIEEETGHAWRPKRVKNELFDLGGTYYFRAGTPFQLMHRNVRDLDYEKGDRVELFEGERADDPHEDGWKEWLSSDEHTLGRNSGDFWLDSENGVLYVYKARWFWDRYRHLRVTYRYGKEQVPATIRNCAAKYAAAELLRSQQFRVTTPGAEEAPDPTGVAESWEEQCRQRLERYKEVRSIGINANTPR